MTHLLDLVITPALADSPSTQAVADGGSPLSLALMFVVFLAFFYFVMWRPQAKRAKEHRDLVGSLQKGDEVVTSGGLLGKIAKITEGYVLLAVHNSAEVFVQKSAIVSALPKGTLKTLE